MENIEKERKVMQTFVKIFPIHSYKELENEINSYLRRKGVELVSASSLDIHHAIAVFRRGGANGYIVEAVRCRDCKFNVANMQKDPLDITDYSGDDIVCSYFMTDGMSPNDFCSNGERGD